MKKNIKFVFVVYIFSIFIGITINTTVSFAWGDSTPGGKGRQTYTLDDADSGKLDDVITFNSFVEGRNGEPLETGSELNFVSALSADADVHDYWEGNNIAVTDGQEYIVRLYVHNNSPKGTAGVSTGTKVAISGVNEHGTWQSKTNKDGKQEVELNGFITSDNATPHEYWDYVRFNSSTSFHLDYVYGSAMIYNRGATGTTDKPISAADMMTATDEQLKAQTITGRPLSDDIVLKTRADGELDGQLIGFDALDGNVPGCYEYSSYITIRVKAVYDYDFTMRTQVRKNNEKEWSDSVDAKIGDRVEFSVEYKNNSVVDQPNVIISNVLPSNLKYIKGTTKHHVARNGQIQVSTSPPEGDLFAHGITIDSCPGGVSAVVSFTAEVVDTDLEYGSNTLVSWGQVNVSSVTQEGYAVVKVYKSGYFEIIILSTVLIIFIICIIILIGKIKKINRG